MLQNVFPFLGTKSDLLSETETKLKDAHKALREYVSIDMHFDTGKTNSPITNSWTMLADGVQQIEGAHSSQTATILNVVFAPNSLLPRHFHNNNEETIFVIEGYIVDNETGIKTEPNGVYTIPAKQPHEIYSKSGALVNMIFRPKLLLR